jgi:hypothetical protein
VSKCIECESARAAHDDPRDPPYEHGICLCLACWEGAADERIDELEREIVGLKEERESKRTPRAPKPERKR